MHSIHLWVQTLGDTQNAALEPLVYPLVQLINGTIKLNYTAKYYPLRFHLSSLLIQLSEQTGKFIPILPYYLDILSQQNFGKKQGKVSMKPMDFSCILRLSKSQMAENGFKDATIEHIYGKDHEILNFFFPRIQFILFRWVIGSSKSLFLPNKFPRNLRSCTSANPSLFEEVQSGQLLQKVENCQG